MSIYVCDAFEVFIHISIRSEIDATRKSLLDINWNWNTILFTNVSNIHFHRKGSPRILWPLSFDWDVNKKEYTKCNGVEWQCIAMAYDSSIFISMTPLDAGLTTSEHWLHTPSIYRRDFRKFYQKKIPTKYWMWAKKALLLVNTIHCLSIRHPECCHSFFFFTIYTLPMTNKQINSARIIMVQPLLLLILLGA